MVTPLLTTKLHAPPVRPELVPRPRLIERLNEGLHCKLTLISSPAGSGKTTLLSEWTRQSVFPVAWLSLDPGDSDPARFWAYLIAALQTIRQGVGEAALAALQSPQPPLIEGLLTDLINEIAQDPASFVLVLEDFHVITDQSVNDGIAFLLNNLPPRLHLILSSRADPPWPLARLRASRQMTELRADDLRFTSEEATAFLNDVMMLDLSREDIAALEDRTEGWIVGLQMAAVSMRGRRDVSAFIKAFTGTHRFVLDYLAEEVLDQQPRSIRDFLLQTCILERLTGSLCDAVTQGTDGQVILNQLEQANLFLIPLDDERNWYRYHHLFADLLHKRLSHTQPDLLPSLHRRASEWYEKNGLVAEAVSYALQAKDVQRAAQLVGGTGLAMLEHGELRVLERWLHTLVDEEMRSEPWLCIAQAWILAFTARPDAVDPLVRRVEQMAAGREPTSTGRTLSESEWQHLCGHVAAVRACVAILQGDSSRTAQLSQDALERLPAHDAMTRAWAAMVLGLSLHQTGDAEGVDWAFSEAVATSQAIGDSHVAVLVLCNVAAVQIERGELRKAGDSLREAMQVADAYAGRAGCKLPVSAYAHTTLGYLLLEWNDLEAALGHLQEAVHLSKRWGEPLRLTGAYLALAKLLQAKGDPQGALEAIRNAKQTAGHFSPWLTARVARVEALICLRQGDTATAFRWADSHKDAGARYLTTPEHWYTCLLRAQIDLARGRPDRALDLLKQVYQEAHGPAGKDVLISSLVLQAIALQAKPDQALAALERALSLAEPEGYVRVFVGEGAPMGELLRQAAARGIALDYVNKLLAALEGETKDDRRTISPGASPMVESLTDRELEVLRLLTTHLSSTEIARQLVISVHTVRSHIKNIYGKLNIHSRADAVRRAKELGLL